MDIYLSLSTINKINKICSYFMLISKVYNGNIMLVKDHTFLTSAPAGHGDSHPIHCESGY
jgi:hypothetical protein